MIVHVSHAPSHISVPAADRNRCPFCGAERFKPPGPCKSCGVSGYQNGEPPAYRRLWNMRRHTANLEIDQEAPLLEEDSPEEIDGLEEIDQDADLAA